MEYKCIDCFQVFKTKQNLIKHQTKVFKCNHITKYKCENCFKYFKTRGNLNKHNEDQVCSDKSNLILYDDDPKIDDSINRAIRSILTSNITNERRVNLLSKYNTNLSPEDLMDFLNLDINLEGKVSYITSIIKTNKENHSISNSTINSNNTTNIQINNFGKEDLSYMDGDYFKNLILNNHIEKGYMTLIKDIYLDKNHPENRTVKVDNLNNKYAFVFNEGKWDSVLKYELKELLHRKNHTLLKMHYNKLKDLMDTAKKDEIRVFLSRDDTGDPHMMYVIDKVVLLFYNGKEIYEI